jgi:hypothetical protein
VHPETEADSGRGVRRAAARARWRRRAEAARRIVLHARSMSDDELLATIAELKVGHLLAGPLAFAAGAVLLVVHAVLLLFTNWRLIAVELLPAIWLATVLWDWRFHVLYGNELAELHGGWAILAAAFVVFATIVSYACNVVFAYVATGQAHTVRGGLRRTRRHRRLILVAGLAVGAFHAWVSVRGPIRGLGTFAIGLGLVALANLYLYSALPAQALGMDRRRSNPKDLVTKTIALGAVSVVVSTPGITLAVIARLLLGIPVLRIVGFVVLAVAVLLQIAAASSSRAVSLSTNVADPAHNKRSP